MAYDWMNATETPSYGYGGYGYAAPLPWQTNAPQQNPLGALLKSGAAARYNLKGMNLRPMQDIGTQISNLANAQYDTNNPLYQQTYEAERGAGLQDLATVIAEMTRQNRKQSMLGRTPLFDPERGGEQQFRQLVTGYQDTQNNARNRAREILQRGQGALSDSFNTQATLATAQNENAKKKAYGMGNIGDLLPLLGKLF